MSDQQAPPRDRQIDLPDDFQDLLAELHDAGAEFEVVGGHAVAFHGHPRATKDLDVLIRPTAANASRVYRALAAFGAPPSGSRRTILPPAMACCRSGCLPAASTS